MPAEIASEGFDPITSEAELQGLVDGCRGRQGRERLLLGLLDEGSSVYRGHGARAVTRMRGYVLAELSHGMPRAALPFVLAELESGREPYSVAAAARALRGLEPPAAAAVPYLLRALTSVQLRDDALTFERYFSRGQEPRYTSAVSEIVTTLTGLGSAVSPWLDEVSKLVRRVDSPLDAVARARLEQLVLAQRATTTPDPDCCRPLSARLDESGLRWGGRRFRRALAVDQQGTAVRIAEHCQGKLSLVAFFYTRCDNPNKCSLTVSRLAQLQRRLRSSAWGNDVQVLGVTYDPGYDSPALLKTYGASRGFAFGPRDRFLRVNFEDWPAVRRYFQLGVGYSGSIVNQHAIELYLLDRRGRPLHSFKRLKWDADEVLALTEREAQVLHGPRWRSWLRRSFQLLTSLGLGLAIALLPKCPLCWAAYFGVFGAVGLSVLPYRPWLLATLAALLALNLTLLARSALKLRSWRPRS